MTLHITSLFLSSFPETFSKGVLYLEMEQSIGNEQLIECIHLVLFLEKQLQ